MFPAISKFIESQTWLDSLGDPLQNYINSLFSNGGETGKQVKDALNGVWLGHPLHPVITDVPVGAWTCTFVLDLVSSSTGNESIQSASDITLATGLTAAAGAAVTGWTDWSDTYGEDRKVGLLHGVTMATTTFLYAFSLVARLTGARKTGVALSNLGYGLMSAGAYLGGDEVYELGYGINHTAFNHGPGKYTALMPEADLEPGKPSKAVAGDVTIVLVKHDGTIYALDDTCVHAGCSLASGHVEGRSIVCPCHGSQFDLRDGSVIHGPATMAEPHYSVRVNNGMVEVKRG